MVCGMMECVRVWSVASWDCVGFGVVCGIRDSVRFGAVCSMMKCVRVWSVI